VSTAIKTGKHGQRVIGGLVDSEKRDMPDRLAVREAPCTRVWILDLVAVKRVERINEAQ